MKQNLKCLWGGSLEKIMMNDLTCLVAYEDLQSIGATEHDHLAIFSDPEHHSLIFSFRPNASIVKSETARDVIKIWKEGYPNCFRTRQEGIKTTTTFWPRGYGIGESYEGVAFCSPHDERVHVIGKAITYFRAVNKANDWLLRDPQWRKIYFSLIR